MTSFAIQISLAKNDASRCVEATLQPVFSDKHFTEESVQASLHEQGFAEYFVYENAVNEMLEAAHAVQEKGQKIHQELFKRLMLSKQAENKGIEEQSGKDEVEPQTETGEPSEKEARKVDAISPQKVFELTKHDPVSFVIAEQRDATAEVSASDDEMQVFLNVSPAWGGESLTQEAVEKIIKASGLKVSIKPGAIDSALNATESSSVLLADGISPRKGGDSPFKPLVNQQISSGPSIDEKGVANYLDINDFVVVEEGQPLMQRLAPGKGAPGKDVYGKVIPSETGEVLPFDANIEGATVDPNDSNILIATIKGHPIIGKRGVSVDPVLHLPNVSLASGNVDYDGTVHVKGDISDGMRVKASGDVIVEGVVGKASIEAGHDVAIQQGLIGGIASESGDTNQYGAVISAKGTVTARFASKAKIRGEVVSLREYASHCDIYAKDKVLIGEKSGKGTLIGGQTEAFNLVYTKVLGSAGSAITSVRIGADASTLEELRQLNSRIREKQELLKDIQENMEKLREREQKTKLPRQLIELREKLQVQQNEAHADISELESEADEFKMLLMKTKKARVIGKLQVYQNVQVSILNGSLKIKEDTTGGHFRFEAKRVVFDR